MVDLNLWELRYPGDTGADVVLEFGTHDSGYPFTKQVVVGPPDVSTADTEHPLNDGIVFGVDLLRGRTIQFAGAHLAGGVAPVAPWTERLDESGVLEAAWSADSVRRRTGAAGVARLLNVERDRCAYGRPRNYRPDMAVVRRGWSEWSGDFVTVDDKFYSPTVTTVPVTLAEGGSDELVVNAGTKAAPVSVTIENTSDTPLVNPRVEARYEDQYGFSKSLWTVGITGQLFILNDVDPFFWKVTIDLRPWVREVSLLSTLAPAQQYPGIYAGSPLADVVCPPNLPMQFYFHADSGPNGATVTVSAPDTYGSL